MGRSLDDDLARRAEGDPTAYWSQLTGAWREAVQAQSEASWKRWKETVGGGEDDATRKLGVSRRCAQVLEHMIRRPIEEEWTARSESLP